MWILIAWKHQCNMLQQNPKNMAYIHKLNRSISMALNSKNYSAASYLSKKESLLVLIEQEHQCSWWVRLS